MKTVISLALATVCAFASISFAQDAMPQAGAPAAMKQEAMKGGEAVMKKEAPAMEQKAMTKGDTMMKSGATAPKKPAKSGHVKKKSKNTIKSEAKSLGDTMTGNPESKM